MVAAAAVVAAAVGKCCADEKCLGEESVEIKNPQSQENSGGGVLGRAIRGEVSSWADGQMGGSCPRTPTLTLGKSCKPPPTKTPLGDVQCDGERDVSLLSRLQAAEYGEQ